MSGAGPIPVVPTTHGMAAWRHPSTFFRTASGRVKSMAASWPSLRTSSPSPTGVTSCPASASLGRSAVPTLPPAP